MQETELNQLVEGRLTPLAEAVIIWSIYIYISVVKKQLSLGNDNPGIGNRQVKNLKNVSEARGRNEGRVYFREKDGKIEILAKSNKDNQNKVIGILQKMGY